jgi:hypothetical protein
MLNIVIFLNAAHQRRYVDILNSALSGLKDVRVLAVDTSADKELSQEAAQQSLIARVMSLKAVQLVAIFIGATFYIPYAGIRMLQELYRRHIDRHLRQVARSVVRGMRHRALCLPVRTIVAMLQKSLAGMKRSISHGISLLSSPPRAAARYIWYHGARSALGFIYRHLACALRTYRRRSFLYSAFSEVRWQRYLDKRLFSLKPDLVVLLEDNAEGLTGLVSHGSRRRSIPCVILPDYLPNPAEPARYYFNDPLHSADTLPGRLARRFAPEWMLEYDGKRLLRLPANAIMVQLMRGRQSPQPWILNAGYTDAILVESKASLRHYGHLGFKLEKLRVIGGAIDDMLHAIQIERDQRRQELNSKYEFDPAKPLIVCSFPPDQYTAATEGFEFKTYGDLCRAWFEALAGVSGRTNIIVVRHPRTKASELSRYATGGVQIATETLESILPVADLYVACISTTIRWALALAIPVINYDTYRYDYGDFSKANACSEVTRFDAFREELERMLQPGELNRLSVVAREDANEWGSVDGKFRTRLRGSLLEICDTYKGPSGSTHREGFRLHDVA